MNDWRAVVTKAVAKEKRKLRRQTARLGYAHENFGQKSIRKLEDEFMKLNWGDPSERSAYQLVVDFYDWCLHYEPGN